MSRITNLWSARVSDMVPVLCASARGAQLKRQEPVKDFAKVVTTVLVAASCLAHVLPVDAQESSSDAEALGKLARSGSDLSKLHRVEFLLRFPTEEDAARAASQLEELAFATTTERDDVEDEWVILAAKVMYPVESDLIGLRDKLNIIAAEGHGTYDGWRATPLSDRAPNDSLERTPER